MKKQNTKKGNMIWNFVYNISNSAKSYDIITTSCSKPMHEIMVILQGSWVTFIET